MRRIVAATVTLSALVAAACGDDASPARDAGGDASLDGGDARIVTPPAPPAPPDFGACPVGFGTASDEAASWCEPWPASGRATCADHEAHFPGAPSCARIGTPCPDDGWPTDLPAGRPTIHVRAGAAGGDGTRGAPFGTLAEAVAAVTAKDAVIALAVGDYTEAVTLPAGVALVGACAERTRVSSDVAASGEAVLRAGGAGVSIRNLTVGPSARIGMAASGPGVELALSDVVVRSATSVAVLVERGATVDLDHVVLRDTVPLPSSVLFGRGLDVESGSVGVARFLAVHDNRDFGIAALEGTLTLEDVVVTGTRANPSGNGGPGLVVRSGTVEARRLVAEDNELSATMVYGEGGSLTLEDATLRDSFPSTLTIAGARGLVAQQGAVARCSRCLLERLEEIAFLAAQASLTVEDAIVRDVRLRARDGQIGRAFEIEGGDVSLARVLVERASGDGALVQDAGRLTATDLAVRDIAPTTDGIAGRALYVFSGSSVTLERVDMTDLSEVGMVVHGVGTTVDATDLRIARVASAMRGGSYGRGLNVQDGARFTGTRVAIEDVREIGVAVFGDALAPEVTIRELGLGPVRPADCAATGCPAAAGHGVGTYGGTLTLDGFEIADAALCGFHVAQTGRVHAANGVVRGCEIGACLQNEAETVDDLSMNVRYRDNDLTLDATTLPVPTPLPTE